MADPTAAPIDRNNPQIAIKTVISWCITVAIIASCPHTVNRQLPSPTRIWIIVNIPTCVSGARNGTSRAVPKKDWDASHGGPFEVAGPAHYSERWVLLDSV